MANKFNKQNKQILLERNAYFIVAVEFAASGVTGALSLNTFKNGLDILMAVWSTY